MALYANLCVALCCLEPAWGAAASPSKSQAAPGVDAKACQASLETQEHKAVQSQNISRHKAQPRHSNVASLYLLIPAMHFRHAATTRFSSLPLYSPLLSSLCTPLLYLSKCSLSYISRSFYFALYAALLLSPLFSVLFALLLSPPLFIPLYAASHRFS